MQCYCKHYEYLSMCFECGSPYRRDRILDCFREVLSETDFAKVFLDDNDTTEPPVSSKKSPYFACKQPNRRFLLSAKGSMGLVGGKDEKICLKCAKFNGYEEFANGDL